MPPRKHKSKRKPERLIGVKVFPEYDQDIIDWWDSLADGQRSETLRALIRKHALGANDLDILVNQIEQLRKEMTRQFGAVLFQLKRTTIAAPPSEPTPSGEQLSAEEIQEREQAILKRRW